MGADTKVVGPRRRWGTWEELVLGGAVLRHGTRDWNVVASELRARTLYPYRFTPEACKVKYEDLQKRYSGCTAWFEELRKRRVAELKRQLEKSEDSIGSLESKIRTLEAQKRRSSVVDCDSSRTESLVPALKSDGKETSKDESSTGSFTKDTSTGTRWLCERDSPAAASVADTDTDVKPEVSVHSEPNKDLSIDMLAETACKNGGTLKKRRGQRKRKECNRDAIEGSMGESDNLGSSNVISTSQRGTLTSDWGHTCRDSNMDDQNGASAPVGDNDLMGIFNSVAKTEPALVFRHRMDSQKRARYRKIIRRHVDINTIRARIASCSIKSVRELFRDLLLLANNALVFYSKRTREYKAAFSLRGLVMKTYRLHCKSSSDSMEQNKASDNSNNCKATSTLLPMPAMCNPPVKPRSARPRPQAHPRPSDNFVRKQAIPENIIPQASKGTEKSTNSDPNISPQSGAKGRKCIKKLGKAKGESAPRPKTPVKERKRVRQR